VLKDAAATAIYGSRGSNGVILITTKSGSYGEKYKINFNAYGGFSRLAKKVPVMNAYELSNYMKLARDLSWINKAPSKNTANDPLEWRNIDDRYPSYILPYVNGQQGLTDTDWQDEFYRTAKMSNYEVSVSGGTEKLRTFISANYMNQEGIIPNSGIERIGLRMNLEAKLHEKVHLGVNINPTFIDNNLVQSEKNWGDEGLVIGTLMQHPQLPAYNEDGSFAVDKLYEVMWSGESNVVQFQNPLALANMVDNRMKQSRIIIGTNIEVNILDGLNFKSAFGSDINYNNRFYYRPKLLSHRLEPAPTTYYNHGTVFNSNYINILWDNTLEYTKRINKVHSLKIVLGNSIQKEINKNTTAEGRNFATDNIRTINTAQERYSNEYRREWSLLSYFSRLSYNYKDKYMLSATVRADGSSKFGKDSKWGIFPSVSAGWRLSDETFFKNDFVDDLKLRASYGLTGNNDIPYYGAIALLSTGGKYPIGDVVQSGLFPSSSPNTNLSWETTRTVDIGVDFSFLKHFTFGVDYYHSNTTDLLLNVPVPSSSGYSSSLQNLGELENKGVEILLGSDFKLFGGNFSASLNFSANRNKVLALGPGQDQIISNGGLTASHITRVGRPIGSFFGYEILGKFETDEQLASLPQYGKQAIGDFIYRNINDDNIIDADDRVILGDNYPDYQVGLNIGYQIKGFDLSVSAYTSQGFEIINTMHRYLAEAWGNNLSVYLSNKAPRPVWGVGSASHTRPSSWQIEDGSFIRIREIILGYRDRKSVV
jgi:TonB-linked SusC/RagA family outer membrane protein